MTKEKLQELNELQRSIASFKAFQQALSGKVLHVEILTTSGKIKIKCGYSLLSTTRDISHFDQTIPLPGEVKHKKFEDLCAEFAEKIAEEGRLTASQLEIRFTES